MARFVDGISLVLLILACGAFAYGLRLLSDKEDLRALYSLVVGGLALKGSVDLLRARGA